METIINFGHSKIGKRKREEHKKRKQEKKPIKKEIMKEKDKECLCD